VSSGRIATIYSVLNSAVRFRSFSPYASSRRIIFRVVIGVILVSKSASRIWMLRGFSGFWGCNARPRRGRPTNYATRGRPRDNERLKNRDFPGREIKQAARKTHFIMKRLFPANHRMVVDLKFCSYVHRVNIATSCNSLIFNFIHL